MKLKPLGDRLIVRAVEEEETTASGLVLPDTAKEKPQKGEVLAVGDGAWDEDGEQAHPARRLRRRHRPLQQVRRHRGQGRRRGPAGPARVRRPGQGRVATAAPTRTHKASGGIRDMAHKELKYGADARGCTAGRRRRRRRRRQGHARPEGPLRRPRQEVRRADDHQRRRHDRPRDRDRGRLRQPGRPARPRGRHGDQRRRRRRHHDGDPARADDRPLGPEERRRRRQPARPPQGHRDGRQPGRREPAREAVEGGRRQGADRQGRFDLGGRRRDRRHHRRRDREGRQGRRRERRRGPDLRHGARVHRGHAVRQGLHLARTWSPTRTGWRRSSRTPTS